MCHKGGVNRLRDFKSIAAFLSERGMDGLQAVVDAGRAARPGRGDTMRGGRCPTRAGAAGPGNPEGGRRAG